jgi:putative Ca2+/H+ antiporter (TMEM165/GDT1 family)
LLFLNVLVGLFYRWSEIKAMPAREKRAVWLAVATSAWLFLSLVALVVVVAAGQERILVEIPLSLKLWLVMPLVFVGLTATLVVTTALAWRHGYWRLRRRLHYTLVALAAVAFCLFFYTWNLLGWQFG